HAGPRLDVDLPEVVGAVDLVTRGTGRIGEEPPVVTHVGIDHGDADGVLQTLQLAQDQGPVRPRTGQRDVEVVTTGFGGKSGGAIGGDAIAEGGGLAEKTALLVREVVLPGPDAVDELSHARDDRGRAGGSPR